MSLDASVVVVVVACMVGNLEYVSGAFTPPGHVDVEKGPYPWRVCYHSLQKKQHPQAWRRKLLGNEENIDASKRWMMSCRCYWSMMHFKWVRRRREHHQSIERCLHMELQFSIPPPPPVHNNAWCMQQFATM